MAEDYKFRKTTLIGLLGKTMGTKLFDWLNPCCDEFCIAVNACIPPSTGIQSVVAGDNIDIDNTDPLNPIISAIPASPYLVLTAIVHNTVGTLTATQLQNTIGDGSQNGTTDILFKYIFADNGHIYAEMTGEFPDANKVFVYSSSINNSGTPFSFTSYVQNANRIQFSSWDGVGVGGANPFFDWWFVEIRIYP